MDNSYYLGFSAFVQIAVAFCFGMLYLDGKSIFSNLQKYIFDGFRKNKICLQLLKYVGSVTRRVKSNSSHRFFLIWRARISQYKDLFNAALNSERTCSYLASTGIVSALFSLTWLLIMPTYSICDGAFERHYLTHCLSVAVASVIMLLYGIFNKSMNRVKAFLISLIILGICCGVGESMLANEICFPYSFNFRRFFPYTLALAYAPVIYYAGHIIIYIIFRSVLLVAILLMTVALHLTLSFRKVFR